MQFIIRAYDGPGKLEERLAVRPDHLKNLKKIMDKVVCAGGRALCHRKGLGED